MSNAAVRVYRFAEREHWETCLMHRFAVGKNGELTTVVALAAEATRIDPREPLTLVAVDRRERPIWRYGVGATARFGWPDEGGGVTGPVSIGGALAETRRLIVTRSWIWAYYQSAVYRYDRDTLQHDRTFALLSMLESGDAVGDPTAAIVDISGDGRDGLWVLIEAEAGGWLTRIDCRGCLGNGFTRRCEIGPVEQIGAVARGETLVLLAASGDRLWFIDPASGGVARTLPLSGLDPRWRATRLATNEAGRIGLGGARGGAPGSPWLFVLLDGTGEPMQEPLAGLFAGAPPPVVADFALGREAVWFATAQGLWRLAPTTLGTTAGSTSRLLTQALHSPITANGRGWLRAEIDAELPEGAVLTVDVATTDNPERAAAANAVANDASLTALARQKLIWAALDDGKTERQPFVIQGGGTPTGTIAVPLFASQDRWLWLKLEIDAPPGVGLPVVRALRVLYPEVTLMDYLPAIFRGAANDPEALLRRLVGVLETSTQEFDETIAAIGRSIEPETAPGDRLDRLGRWLALPWHDALPEAAKRAILSAAGDLLDERGTRAGLARLLRCLLGARGRAEIVDLTVDFSALTLGGGSCAGSTLPALLAGTPRGTLALNGKAVLGCARLPCPGEGSDPLATLPPTLRITITADAPTRQAIAPVIEAILEQFVPAALRMVVTWRSRPAATAITEDGIVLEGAVEGAVGRTTVIGATLLSGRSLGRIGELGLEAEFRLP